MVVKFITLILIYQPEQKLKKTGNIGSDKIISNTKRKVLIRPLPKIQDLIPFENDDAIR